MWCYQRHEQEAVGVCHCCGKALCEECATDLGFALTCKGKCAERAAAYNKINENAVSFYAAQKKNRFFLPFFIIGMGLLLGGFNLAENSDPLNFGFLAGLAFVVFGCLLFLIQKKWARQIKT